MEKRIGSMVLVKHVTRRWEYRPLIPPLTPEQRAKIDEAHASISEEEWTAMRAMAREWEEGMLRNYYSKAPQ